MSEIPSNATFTPEAAAQHLQIDYTVFMLQWLPKYSEFLSESGQGDPVVLTTVDLALLEQVAEHRRNRVPHAKICAMLRKMWKPGMTERVAQAIRTYETVKRAQIRHKRRR